MSSASIWIEDYRSLLRSLLKADLVPSVRSTRSIGSGWGTSDRPFREQFGCSLSFASDALLLHSVARPVNHLYAIASSIWLASGRSDVATLTPFNSRGREFADESGTLCGAFGFRLMTLGPDQIAAAVRLLKEDPSTRRAVCFIGRPSDIVDELKDYPCASLVQWVVRSGSLYALVYMRSQSLFGVFPYDLVNFRYLQHYVGWLAGFPVGTLTFVFGSAHIYEEETPRIEQFVAEPYPAGLQLPSIDWAVKDQLFDEWAMNVDALRNYLRSDGIPVA